MAATNIQQTTPLLDAAAPPRAVVASAMNLLQLELNAAKGHLYKLR